MAEYNMNYLSLKKRLFTLKLLTESDMNLPEGAHSNRVKMIDSLLKQLDERYSENQPLSMVEAQLEEVEKRNKKNKELTFLIFFFLD